MTICIVTAYSGPLNVGMSPNNIVHSCWYRLLADVKLSPTPRVTTYQSKYKMSYSQRNVLRSHDQEMILARIVLCSGIGAAFVAYWASPLIGFIQASLPQPDEDAFWAKDRKPHNLDTKIRPFQINISDNILERLRNRLETMRNPAPTLEGIGFAYGTNSVFLETLRKFWLEEYDWRKREAVINMMPQFTTFIEGLDIHFIHIKSKKKDTKRTMVPILMLHGWPGSFVEFLKVIPLLSEPTEEHSFDFEIVIPSLPGYGFSNAATKPGLGPVQIAQIMRKLMERLGYKNFYIQGGDWGSIIGSFMGLLYPERVKGIHLNLCYSNTLTTKLKYLLGSVWPSLLMDEWEASQIYPVEKLFKYALKQFSYAHIQGAIPDSIGVGLDDSPLGLAAHLLQMFSSATNKEGIYLPDGGLRGPFTLTELLDNVMIYYVTGTITSSIRLYYEYFSLDQWKLDSIPLEVPTGCAVYPQELLIHPESFVRDRYPNLVSFTRMPAGGHFAAMEQTESLAKDIWHVVGHIERRNNI